GSLKPLRSAGGDAGLTRSYCRRTFDWDAGAATGPHRSISAASGGRRVQIRLPPHHPIAPSSVMAGTAPGCHPSGYHHGTFPVGAGAACAGPPSKGTGSPAALIVIPFSPSRSRNLSSLLLTAAAASARTRA